MRPLRAARPLPSAGAARIVHPRPMEEKPKKRRSGPSGPSGKHANARRTLSGISDERWAAYDALAKSQGVTRNEWARTALEESYARQSTRQKKSTD